MRDLIVSIFGEYTPVVDASGVIPSGAAGVDWPYVLGILLFAICLYSIFRILGAILRGCDF